MMKIIQLALACIFSLVVQTGTASLATANGGIISTLEVDVLSFIGEQAINRDDVFQAVLNATEKDDTESEIPVVPLFVKHFNDIAKPKGKSLKNYFYVAGARNSDDVSIQALLQKLAGEAVDHTIEIIRKRVNQFGLASPSIKKEGSRRIIIELPDVSDPAQVRRLISCRGLIEFRLLKDTLIVRRVFESIDKYLADNPRPANTPSSHKSADELMPEKSAVTSGSHQFSAIIAKGEGYHNFLVSDSDRAQIESILSRPGVQRLYADKMSFMFGRPIQARKAQNFYEIYFLNSQPELSGKVIANVHADLNSVNQKPEVTMKMDDSGSRVWRRLTRQNISKQVAIILDSVVNSAPYIFGELPNGTVYLFDVGDMTEANLLRIVVEEGALPAPVKLIRELALEKRY
jgi:SecD/SecF fusion protein